MPKPFAIREKTLSELALFDRALDVFNAALKLRPDLAEAWLGRGHALAELKQFSDALASYDRALKLNPDFAQAWHGRGNICSTFAQYDDALTAYGNALKLVPQFAEAWLGYGNACTMLNRYDDASAAFDKALALVPDLAEAWKGRGNVHTALGQHRDAFVAYDQAFKIKPALYHVEGARLHAKMLTCDWTDLDAEASHLLAGLRDGKPVSHPFPILSIPSSPADQLNCAKRFLDELPRFAKVWRGEIYSHDRIRVAYLSTDLRDHVIGFLTVRLFEQHDTHRFETTAISIGPDDGSALRQRIKNAFEHFIDARSQTDQEIAELIRRLEIDIVVDLNGLTGNARPGILAGRPAPVQVYYLGHPGTTGADFVDYILADSTVIPEDQRQYFSENVVWLPDSYLPNDSLQPVAEPTPTRAACGLPETAFVFCCFNNTYKIAPAMFHAWMRMLKASEGSVLWLSTGNPATIENLRREAATCGIAPERLIFAARVPAIADHLARYRQADLFLDTLPYNAHTTAGDALWAGLPVLTCIGSTFAGRVAASVLNAIGLPELITNSLEDYEATAQKLAKERALLAALKEKLVRNRTAYPLFDTERLARHIESAYTTMVERQRRGDSPRGFAVKPLN
ncbi:MAG: tetratricopeptide repeat protein [Pseudolabrys sp.]